MWIFDARSYNLEPSIRNSDKRDDRVILLISDRDSSGKKAVHTVWNNHVTFDYIFKAISMTDHSNRIHNGFYSLFSLCLSFFLSCTMNIFDRVQPKNFKFNKNLASSMSAAERKTLSVTDREKQKINSKEISVRIEFYSFIHTLW